MKTALDHIAPSGVISPINTDPLMYGSEIWGFHKSDDIEKVHMRFLKGTRFSLYGLGGLPSLLQINSPDIIAHIKGLSYLRDYIMVISATLGGAFKG